MTRLLTSVLVLSSLISATASAQWGKAADQTQLLTSSSAAPLATEFITTIDSSYAAWFEATESGGHSLRFQRFDAAGASELAAGGVELALLGSHVPERLGLATLNEQRLALTFIDDRFGPLQVSLILIDTDGQPIGEGSAIAVSDTGVAISAPLVVTLSFPASGWVLWNQGAGVAARRISVDGTLLGSEVSMTDPAGVQSLISARPSGLGNIILTMERSSFPNSVTEIVLQQLIPNGSFTFPIGGARPTLPSSIHYANETSVTLLSNNTSTVAWMETSAQGRSQVQVQSMTSSGFLRYSIGGVTAGLDPSSDQTQPKVVSSSGTFDSLVFWIHKKAGLTEIRGQRITHVGGMQLWEPEGRVFLSAQSAQVSDLEVVPDRLGNARIMFVQYGPGPRQTIKTISVSPLGDLLSGASDVATSQSLKSGLIAYLGPLGDAVAVWSDQSSANGTQLAGQNTGVSGQLGPFSGIVPNGRGVGSGRHSGEIGPLGGQAILRAFSSTPSIIQGAFGIVLGYAAPATIPYAGQTIFVNLAGDELLSLPVRAADDAQYVVNIPNDAALCGHSFYTQGALFGGTLSNPLLTNGLRVFLGQ